MTTEDNILAQKVIISTRPAERNAELQEQLESRGAKLLSFPTVELQGIHNTQTEECILQLGCYSHLLFSSVFGFRFFWEKLQQFPQQLQVLQNLKIVALGYKTAEVIQAAGLRLAFDANAKTGQELFQKFKIYLQGHPAKVLWPTGNLTPEKPIDLGHSASSLTRIHFYRNTLPEQLNKELVERIQNKDYDVLVVASPSAFNNLYQLVPQDNLQLICIGQVTAQQVREQGLCPAGIAKEPTAKGITEAIIAYQKKKMNAKI